MKDIGHMPPAEDPLVEKLDIGYLVKVLSERFQAHATRRMKEKNLTMSQIQTMICIHTHGGAVSQKAIENYLHVSHPTVVGIVSRMEKKGYVTTHQDEQDHRNKIVSTTKLADQLRDEAEAAQTQLEQDLCRGMTDAEVRQLKQLMMKVYHNLD